MKIIVATNRRGFIGKEGKMMWKSSDDFRHFKKLTSGPFGNLLIVGKTTFENDLKGKGLSGRKCIVVGTGYNTLLEAVEKATFESRLVLGTENNYGNQIRDIWVIGGSSIYQQLLPLAKEIHMSIINNEDEGDMRFEIPSNYRGQVFKYEFNCE